MRKLVTVLLLLSLQLAGCATSLQPLARGHSAGSSSVEQLRHNKPRAFAKAILDNFDIDSDSTVSCDEFLLATIQIFNSMDVNQDLKLNQQEVGALWTKATNAADVNQDHALSFSEVLRDLDDQCRNYDSDRDGSLSVAELEVFAVSRTAPEGR